MISPIQQALVFIINTVFNIYITIVLIRFCLQVVRADFYNPLSQFVVKATNPLLVPLRRFIPGLAGIDLASIVLLIVLQAIENSLILLIHGYVMSINSITGICIWGIGELIDLTIVVYLLATFSISYFKLDTQWQAESYRNSCQSTN